MWCGRDKEMKTVGLNRELLGKEYPPQGYDITAEETKKYAYGYNEDLSMFLDESRPGGLVAPPMFGVKYAGLCIAQAFFDQDLGVNFARLVHGEQSMEFLAPVKPGDKISSVGRIARIEQKSTGEIFAVETSSRNQTGIPVLKQTATFFIRGKQPESTQKKRVQKPAERDYLFTQDMQVKHDQTYIYAEGSGDHNPIHVDPAFAKQVGLPGIILQGLCTSAFCFKAIQDNVCGKDPAKVQSLQVRFARPVLPLDTVTTRAWIEDKMSGRTALGFDAVNQKGDIVIRNGLASVLTA
jgi:acyl dehydratase